MEYKIVASGDRDKLSVFVNEAIKEGWEPTGGVAVSDRAFYQAMVRKAGYSFKLKTKVPR